MLISRTHSILAHLGTKKSIPYLRSNIWWHGLSTNIQAYCETCGVCAFSKLRAHTPYELLKPLEVVDHPWELIGLTSSDQCHYLRSIVAHII